MPEKFGFLLQKYIDAAVKNLLQAHVFFISANWSIGWNQCDIMPLRISEEASVLSCKQVPQYIPAAPVAMYAMRIIKPQPVNLPELYSPQEKIYGSILLRVRR